MGTFSKRKLRNEEKEKLQMKKEISIYEVGPRDGFQNIKDYIQTENKMEVIDSLVQSGAKHIQITSFVSPRAIPQMKDAEEIAMELSLIHILSSQPQPAVYQEQ